MTHGGRPVTPRLSSGREAWRTAPYIPGLANAAGIPGPQPGDRAPRKEGPPPGCLPGVALHGRKPLPPAAYMVPDTSSWTDKNEVRW